MCYMRSTYFGILAATVIVVACPSVARAADKLDALIKKESLTSEDKARIDQEVQERAGRLQSAADDSPGDRAKARESLIETAQTRGATEAALSYYAERNTRHLMQAIVGESRPAAEDAALVLRSLKHPATVPALIAGLKTPHEAVRYHCAVGIKNLQKEIAADRSQVIEALDALGDAGEETKSEPLLRAIYEAVNFAGSNPNFAQADAQARALSKIFDARLKRLALGSRDELKDRAGYTAALDAARAGAAIQSKRDLLNALLGFLQVHADRFGDRETVEDYLPTMRGLVDQLERAIAGILATENQSPPGSPLSKVIRAKPSRNTAKAARDAVRSIVDGLNREPWKAP